MKAGLDTGRIPEDLLGRPSTMVVEGMARFMAARPDIASNVLISLTPESPRHIRIGMLRSGRRRLGHAGRALDELVRLCDDSGVVLHLQSVSRPRREDLPMEDHLEQDDLDAFYGRRGFIVDDRDWRAYALVRIPRNV